MQSVIQLLQFRLLSRCFSPQNPIPLLESITNQESDHPKGAQTLRGFPQEPVSHI